jgi:tetratricopeptide (TPR) repeat protein
VAAFLAGCRTESDYSPADNTGGAATPDLDAEISRATENKLPILVLVVESGKNRADNRARKLFETIALKGQPGLFQPVLIDLSISRNRALAARFHVTDTPLLLGLSPHGLIMTRDQKPLTKELVRSRVEDVTQKAPALDAKLGLLEDAAPKNTNDAVAQMALADFLLAQQNDREAIPQLEVVAHNEAVETTPRIHAWVELARAHFWIAESEKGRHEVNNLIATLGPDHAEARAGGNLALGVQDANTKRFARARQELDAAIAASPESDYARQAAEALAKLPGGNK